MKYLVKKILKFLFPEAQIIDVIKQEGFIVKRKKGVLASVPMQGSTVSQNTVIQNQSSVEKAVSTSTQKIESNYKPSSNSMSTHKVKDKFEGIEGSLRKNWIACQKNVEEICEAFKRPYIMGYDGIKPRSTVLLIGGESHGKVKVIQEMSKLLKQRGITGYAEVSSMDMGIYLANSEETLFLSDLYKVLYSPSDMIVFENIEKIDYVKLDILMQLIQVGKYHLQKRYMMQNNMLVEATGILNTSAISALMANGKYFVFTSTMSEAKVLEYFGNKFAKEINDVIVLEDFNKLEIQEITGVILGELINKVRKQLHMVLSPDTSFIEHVQDQYNSSTGIKGLESYMHKKIYKPLVEYRMKNSVSGEEEISIQYKEGYFITSGNHSYKLDAYMKQYDALTLETIKAELSDVIGLSAVKEYVLNLENNLAVQQLRKGKGLKTADISMHMIFTGNPGTGKTTIARIVAKYLKAMGVLSSGQLREVSRSDMVGQYVGHTAKLTTEIIASALGGVLFIDEAYSLCRDKNDIFGLEAIDALIKGIEDHRDDLVVILAGYNDEMIHFLKTNPGLKSRFPNMIEFEDYTPEEMYRIAEVTAKGKGYYIADHCKEAMLDEFERKQIKGRNDSGNGRLVRNMIEAAILKQSQRMTQDPSQDLERLTIGDFGLDQKKVFNLEEELSTIIGLESVKDFVRMQYHVILAREKRKKADLKVDTTQSLNMIFRGNPGTGKTTMARVVARMLSSMGLLKSGHLVETDKGGLIAEYMGQTAKKTEEVFKSALGGVLFIDEAYAITNDGSSFGQECIDTLVKLIEDYRGEIVVILGGYSKEMADFMKANSGLESRFPLNIEFPDYSAEELYEIGKLMVSDKGFQLTSDSESTFKEAIYNLRRYATQTSGNGRMVRNFIDEIIRNQSSRIAMSDVSVEEMTMIHSSDIIPEKEEGHNSHYDLEADLKHVIGLESVKKYIRSLNARLRVEEERRKQGLKVNSTQTLHMIFKGNPGTGKTMMARMVANVLFNMGIITSNKMIETDRSNLVAGYVGQTALKTREVIESALDGVLFIDEAYALAKGGSNDFGKEAIDTLVKLMDDNRERLVVILAGYDKDMEDFLNQNAGLKSRFPNIISFEDYSTEELLEIAHNMYKEHGYIVSPKANDLLKQVFEQGRQQAQFGNGRYVRNIFEKSLNNQALRLSGAGAMSTADLLTIEAEDIKGVLN